MHDKCFGKMEKALNLWVEDMNRDRSHVTFITVYCYNCSILLLVVNLNVPNL